MAFHFRLETILRLWQGRERQERQKLEALGARLAALRSEMQRARENGIESRRSNGKRLAEGAAGAELHFIGACEDNRQSFLDWLQEQMNMVESEHQKQMDVYRAVERQRKIFENLRRRQMEIFRQEEDRREQKRLDEVFLLTRATAERTQASPGRIATYRRPKG